MPHEPTGNPNGRPPRFKTVEEMDVLIEEYFKDCEGEFLRDRDGDLLLDKNNMPIKVGSKPLTVTGLALFLGFNSRKSLFNYEDKGDFLPSILRAKTIIENYAESRLYDKEGVNGAKFVLSNNYGWAEKSEKQITSESTITTKTDLSVFSVAELKEMLGEE